jgi:hypothetical protein
MAAKGLGAALGIPFVFLGDIALHQAKANIRHGARISALEAKCAADAEEQEEAGRDRRSGPALPFVILGPGAVIDYIRLVLDRGDGDLTNSTYGQALLSWSGFWRALTGESQPLLWLLTSIATLAVYARIWLTAGAAVSLAAAVPTFLLIIPHSHPQDWTLMATSAALLLSLRWSPLGLAGTAALLLGVLIGANEWIHATRAVEDGASRVYWVSLAAAGLLVWLAALTLVGSDRDEIGNAPEVAGAT